MHRQVRSRADCVIVLGGVGADAHSVGLIILHRFLLRAGFQVRYLATQNPPAELCRAAGGADAVLVSNMDGHAAYYLHDLGALRQAFGGTDIPWYLGGNPSLGGDDTELLALGFDRVFLSYVEPQAVVALLDADLAVTAGPPPIAPAPAGALREHRANDGPPAGTAPRPAPAGGLGLGARLLAGERDEVLHQWSTGAAALDLGDNAAFLSRVRSLSEVQRDAAAAGHTLVHPRCGVADVEQQRALFEGLRGGGADVLSFQIDSFTRNNAYSDIELLLKQEGRRGADPPALNGFPLVNHGVAAVRALIEEFGDMPIQVRHSTRDPRLLAEVAFAGGITAFEGGALTYNLPYFRDYPPRVSVRRWRYVDALAASYHRQAGVVIDREFFGVLTATLVPPCIAIAANVLEALLAAEQGVRSVSLGYAEQGHRAQDVAAIRAMQHVGRRFLERYGCANVAVYTVFHQYMGAFPEDPDKARQLLAASAVSAMLSGATRLMLKTFTEALRIPSAEQNVACIALVRQAQLSVRGDEVDWADVAEHEELIVAETTAILDAVLRAGGGDPGEALVRGVERGFLDVPFSPSVWNAGRVVAVRDSSGAVRIAEPADLPLPEHVRAHHRAAVARRLAGTSTGLDEILERDVLQVARGDFDHWPIG